MEALILAGGLGTRLRGAIGDDIPKPLAPVNGLPFIYYLMRRLALYGVQRVVVASGHLAHRIGETIHSDRFTDLGMEIVLVKEDPQRLLGTGGAIVNATNQIQAEDFLVLNGDTYSDIDLKNLFVSHLDQGADLTVAVREVSDATRYGQVILDTRSRVVSFNDRGSSGQSVINAGIYVVRKAVIRKFPQGYPLSMEKEVIPDLIEKNVEIVGHRYEGYFIDIGVPADYQTFIDHVSKGSL